MSKVPYEKVKALALILQKASIEGLPGGMTIETQQQVMKHPAPIHWAEAEQLFVNSEYRRQVLQLLAMPQ